MGYKVYILFSELHRRTYVGFSEDTEKRRIRHNNGDVTSTRKYRPGKILFEEACKDYQEAERPRGGDLQKREKYYKSGVGRRKIKSIFDDLKLN